MKNMKGESIALCRWHSSLTEGPQGLILETIRSISMSPKQQNTKIPAAFHALRMTRKKSRKQSYPQ